MLKDEWKLAEFWKEVVFLIEIPQGTPQEKTTKFGMADDRSIFQVCIY